MLHLVVGNKNYSSWSLRAWLALAEIGAPFDETVIPLYVDNWSEKILKHSKAGLVPILHDGDVTIWDSLAICEYLAERHPALWPIEGPAAPMLGRCRRKCIQSSPLCAMPCQ